MGKRFDRVRAGCMPAAGCLLALLSGCAHVYVDEQGRTHVAGLMWLTLPVAEGARGQAGQALRMRALGLSVTRSEVASSLVFGYHDTTLAFLRNHSLVDSRELLLGRAGQQEEVEHGPIEDRRADAVR